MLSFTIFNSLLLRYLATRYYWQSLQLSLINSLTFAKSDRSILPRAIAFKIIARFA